MTTNAFLSLLLLLFVGLKLTGYIGWSWWWVLSPFWIPTLVAILAFCVVLVLQALETPQEKAARLLREYGEALSRRKS